MITLILFVLGFVLLIVGAEALVKGASRLAASAGVSTLVVGLTVVAYGTSAPELAVNVYSNFSDPPKSDLAIGNVVGSNISNVLLVLGSAALIGTLVVSQNVVRGGVPLMIAVSIVMLLMGWDGVISRWEGVALVVGAIVYTVVTIMHSRRENRAAKVREAETRALNGEAAIEVQPATIRNIVVDLLLVAIGISMLVLGSKWLVDGAVAVAKAWGVSELIVGLTIVAIGTSLPEVAASIVAVLRGERDLAVGNVVGSNLFNVLMVIGVTAVVAPAGIAVSDAALTFDIPVMIVVAVACLPVFFTESMITRWEGGVFLAYYGVYIAYLTLQATEHDALHAFRTVVLCFATPLTVLTFVIVWANAYRRKNRRDSVDQ